MTTKELYQKLNELSEKLKFQVKEYEKDQFKIADDSDVDSGLKVESVYKNEVEVYGLNKSGTEKYLLFKLVPPNDQINLWRIDIDSQVQQWDLLGLDLYIKELQLAKQFIAEKSDDNAWISKKDLPVDAWTAS